MAYIFVYERAMGLALLLPYSWYKLLLLTTSGNAL